MSDDKAELTVCLISSQRCWMGLRSGLCAGQSTCFSPHSEKQVFHQTLAVCMGTGKGLLTTQLKNTRELCDDEFQFSLTGTTRSLAQTLLWRHTFSVFHNCTLCLSVVDYVVIYLSLERICA